MAANSGFCLGGPEDAVMARKCLRGAAFFCWYSYSVDLAAHDVHDAWVGKRFARGAAASLDKRSRRQLFTWLHGEACIVAAWQAVWEPLCLEDGHASLDVSVTHCKQALDINQVVLMKHTDFLHSLSMRWPCSSRGGVELNLMSIPRRPRLLA